MRIVLMIMILVLSSKALLSQHVERSKKVTIELSNISLGEAITILSISYNIEFSYSDDVVPHKQNYHPVHS